MARIGSHAVIDRVVYTIHMVLHLNPKLEVRKSKIQGKGLFANVPFKKGDKFHVVTGGHDWRIMTDKEFQDYIRTVESYDAQYIGGGLNRVSSVSRDEDPSNYGNHSCDPNTAPDEDGRIALRDMAAGEAITIDYGFMSPKTWSMQCNCGASNCT